MINYFYMKNALTVNRKVYSAETNIVKNLRTTAHGPFFLD